MRTRVQAIAIAVTVLTATAVTTAQTSAQSSEEVEPRIIGTADTMVTGFSGYIDRFFSSERGLPFNYSMQIDVGRFVTRTFVVRGGVRGSGSIGGDDSEDLPTGQGVPSLHGFAGLLHYFTPQSMASVYAGADYWAQITQRNGTDAGTIIGVAGVQGALSSRVSLFLEGGYGAALQKNDDDVRVTRIVGQIGVRLKF
jgi:hypothetical protein